MAYTKTNWQDLSNQTTPINASNLNNIENGIKTNDDKLVGNTLIDKLRVKKIEGKNLLSPSNIKQGIYNVAQGVYVEGSDVCCTAHMIEIDNTKHYVLSVGNTQNSYMYVMFYDSSKTYLGYINTYFSEGELKLYTYANYSSAKYINFRFDVTINNLVNPQLEISDAHTTFEPYVNYIGYDNYSYKEYQIGYWADGKPLYRNVIKTTTPNNDSVGTIGTLSNTETITRIDGILYSSGQSIPLNWIYSTTAYNSLYVESNNIQCKISNSTYQNKSCIVIVEYTKTTD